MPFTLSFLFLLPFFLDLPVQLQEILFYGEIRLWLVPLSLALGFGFRIFLKNPLFLLLAPAFIFLATPESYLVCYGFALGFLCPGRIYFSRPKSLLILIAGLIFFFLAKNEMHPSIHFITCMIGLACMLLENLEDHFLACLLIPLFLLCVSVPSYFKIEPGSEELFLKLQKRFKVEWANAIPPKPGFFKKLDSLKKPEFDIAPGAPSSVLFPLRESPLRLQGDKVRFSRELEFLYPYLKKHYPLFYIFAGEENYFVLGFHDMIDFYSVVKVRNAIDWPSDLSPLLYRSGIGYFDMMERRPLLINRKTYTPLSSLLDPEYRPTLAFFHKKFSHFAWKPVFQTSSPHPANKKENIQNSMKSLIHSRHFEILESFLLMYDYNFGRDAFFEKIFIQFLEKKPGTGLTAYLQSLLGERLEPVDDLETCSIYFHAREKMEQVYVHYGAPFDYLSLASLGKRCFELSSKGNPYFLNRAMVYEGRRIQTPEYDQPGCGNSGCRDGSGNCQKGSCPDGHGGCGSTSPGCSSCGSSIGPGGCGPTLDDPLGLGF